MLALLRKLWDELEPLVAEIINNRARQDQELESSPVDRPRATRGGAEG